MAMQMSKNKYIKKKEQIATSNSETAEMPVEVNHNEAVKKDPTEITNHWDAVMGIHPDGWGSQKTGYLDPKTGQLAKIERNPNMKDYWHAAGYLNFLEAQFNIDDKEQLSNNIEDNEKIERMSQTLFETLEEIYEQIDSI